MTGTLRQLAALVFALLALTVQARSADLVIAAGGKTRATVVVAANAGPWEKRAAQDLVHYILRITQAQPSLAEDDEAARQALRGPGPVLVVGEAALALAPELRDELKRVAKPSPQLRAIMAPIWAWSAP